MRIVILTNEYPPHVYGGAGVHVEYLTRELTRLEAGTHCVRVLCFGDQQLAEGGLRVDGVGPFARLPHQDARHERFFDTMARNLVMSGMLDQADVVHCHTWYTHFAGCLIKQLTRAKLVLTTHSLEPHRPWKVEQLGTAYHASAWVERTAYENADGVIAVSRSMREDVHQIYDVSYDKIRVIPNGIDLGQYRPTPDRSVLAKYRIDEGKPYLLFVGRITRQKGIIHLLSAIKHLNPDIQVVLCAGAPDTPEIEREISSHIQQARRDSPNPLVWLAQVLPKEELIALYSQAALFVCPSVYEPFGIINLEAMACGTPVVASAVGGITEVVVPDKTGVLVPFQAVGDGDFEPRDPARFAADLAGAVNHLIANPKLLKEMGIRSRERVEHYFGWSSIARFTLDYYWDLVQA
jgi:glycogen synthase